MARPPGPLRRTHVPLLGILAAVLGHAQPVMAQQKISQSERAAAARSEMLLLERNREFMHPGDPLRVSGVEQGSNDIRSRTPALGQSDRSAALLDPEDQHRRALAIYEQRAYLPDPVKTLVAASGGQTDPAATGPAGQATGEIAKNHRAEVLGLALCGILCAWIAMRRGIPFRRRPAGGT